MDDKCVDFIVERVVSESSGMFLWVSDVVTSIILGMRNGESLSELIYRLDVCPSSLEGRYSMMLEKIENQYRIETSICLQLAVAAQNPLSFGAFNYALSEQYLTMDEYARDLISTKTRKSISRCRGFLEVQSTDSE